ncbi:MAG: molybdopterin converting factor subunit 1 [Hyphomicrobium sp.]
MQQAALDAGAAARSVRLVYFAWVRERIGRAEETLVIPPGIADVAQLMAWLAARSPEYADAFKRPEIIRAAIDRAHVRSDQPLAGAREIAFFPPVTGG